MTVELVPVGTACNLKCTYCYENPQRDAKNISALYDVDKMLAALDKTDARSFTLFGGEPLLVPLVDLERFFAHGLRKYGHNNIQTNGSLITADHLDLFRKYNVYVGISVDGPGDLNGARLGNSPAQTAELTKKTMAAIDALCRLDWAPSLIVTLHRLNATAGPRERLKSWFKDLDCLGVRSVRLHTLEIDGVETRSMLKLTDKENVEAFIDLLEFREKYLRINFDMFDDMLTLLRGDHGATSCVWNSCDPYTTSAVHGIDGDGTLSNCGHVAKDGVNFRKSDTSGHERQLALYRTPQAFNGCQGCRFFVICKGYCPGGAVDNDWRNRTELCGTIFGLLEYMEARVVREGVVPISLSPDRSKIEQNLLQSLRVNSRAENWHTDTPHEDSPHVDWFGGQVPVGRPA